MDAVGENDIVQGEETKASKLVEKYLYVPYKFIHAYKKLALIKRSLHIKDHTSIFQACGGAIWNKDSDIIP